MEQSPIMHHSSDTDQRHGILAHRYTWPSRCPCTQNGYESTYNRLECPLRKRENNMSGKRNISTTFGPNANTNRKLKQSRCSVLNQIDKKLNMIGHECLSEKLSQRESLLRSATYSKGFRSLLSWT